MAYFIGLLLSSFFIATAMHFLHLDWSVLFDDVAMAIVFGGTFAVFIVFLPWKYGRVVPKTLLQAFIMPRAGIKFYLMQVLDFVYAKTSNLPIPAKVPGLCGQILRDGDELMNLRFTSQEIEVILRERLQRHLGKISDVINVFRSLSKFPPAFGLIGTVLGLANLMRGITEGMDPKETGVRMAIALVATLYGLVVANIIVAPCGEIIQKWQKEEELLGELALQAVVLAVEQVSIVKSQEMLNSYVQPTQRINYIALKYGEMRDAA